MKDAKQEIKKIFSGDELSYAGIGSNKDIYIPVAEENFAKKISSMYDGGFDLVSLFCAESFAKFRGFTLFYAFEKKGVEEIIVVQRALKSNKATSIAETFPSAYQYEREIADGFGVEFVNAFDKRRLFLHERYPGDFHPLLK